MSAVVTGSTMALAEFASSISIDDLPEDVVQLTARQSLDTIGVALVGASEPAVEIALATLPAVDDGVTVWGRRETAGPADAAFANGISAHALDFDDFWLPGAHPSAPILPAAFAVAESRHSSGAEFIAAQAVGLEIMGRLHSVTSQRAGWHPTSIFGTFGAAAACSRLLGLSADQTAQAFGIAFSLTGGVGGVEGKMAKPLNAGHAAHGGVRAALLAAGGFTAPAHVFDGAHSFFDTFYPSADHHLWRLTAGLGEHYHVQSPGIGLKAYPAGYYMHHSFEATLQLVLENDLTADDIASVTVGIRPGRPFNRPRPGSVLEAKFSLQYMVAMAVLHRSLTIDSFDEGIVFDVATASMLEKIDVYIDPALPDNPDITFNPVTVTRYDGTVLTRSEPLPKSHWRYPLLRADWLGKFMDNAARRLSGGAAQAVVAAFDDIREVNDVADVAVLLRPAEV